MIKDKLKLFLKFVKNEYTFPSTPKEKISNALFWGLKVFFILLIFRPFGLSDESRFFFFYTCFGFGLITFFVFALNNFTIRSFMYVKLHNKWYIWHELRSILFLIPQVIILNYLFFLSLDSKNVFLVSEFLKISFYTIDVLVILFFLNVIYYLTLNFQRELLILQTKLNYFVEIEKLNRIFSDESKMITLKFGNESVKLQKERILYVCAWGNYIKIYVLVNNELTQIIKRGKFKETVNELSGFPEFYQCHRSYVANLIYANKVIGTNKKPLLILNNDIEVPVSRENSKPLKELMGKIKHHNHTSSIL